MQTKTKPASTASAEMPKENKMGNMPVGKLVLTMSLPMMISMLVQAMYNIVDSIFVAKISENALTAVSLAFPMQTLMIAVGSGTGVGVNALLSKRLGEKRFEDANSVANNGIFLYLCNSIGFLLLGLFVAPTFFAMQTDIPEIRDGGTAYLQIVQCFSFGLFGQFIAERLMQATGKTTLSMITQSVGAILNIILDPIMIFGLFGFPAMGITGAALATVIGQICSAILGVFLNIRYNREIKLQPFRYRPNKAVIGAIYKIAVPSIAMQSIGSIMTTGMNNILLGFSSTAAAVFGVYFKLQSFIFMPVFGLNNGIVPIISYNFGANKRDRMTKTIKFACALAVGIMFVGIAIMQIFPAQLFSLFDASAHMLEIGVPALRIISLSFIFAGYCITVGSVFQALGNGVYSMITSFMRQLCVLLPVAYFMSLTGNINLVWLSFPIAELASVGFSTLFLVRIYKKVIRHVGN